MKIIILGAGTVGFQLAKVMADDRKDVVIIDSDAERIKFISERLDCLIIQGEAGNIQVLKAAGMKDADFFLALSGSDEMNIVSCSLVSSVFHVPKTIARIRNIHYLRSNIFEKHINGISYLLNPETESANVVITSILSGMVSDVLCFDRSELQMRNIQVQADSVFCGRTVQEIRALSGSEFLLAGIFRSDEFFIPAGSTIVQENDNCYFMAHDHVLREIFSLGGKKTDVLSRIVIAGAGDIGGFISRSLLGSHIKLTIIDNNKERCKRLASDMPDALILHADISSENIFEDEKLYHNDLFIACTSNQEVNLLTALRAKHCGIKKTAAIVKNNSFSDLALKLGIDLIVNVNSTSVNSVLRYLRGHNISRVYTLFGGTAEVIELTVGVNCPVKDILIRDIKMPSGSLILSVSRDGKTVIAQGNIFIHKGDSLVLISEKTSIPDIETLFINKS